MCRKFFIFFIAGILSFAFTTQALAKTLLGDYLKEKGIEAEISASVDFYSKYVWRGFLLDDDPVIQPSVTLSVAGFEGGFWGSWDVDQEDALASDEVDGWIGYSFDLAFINEALEIISLSFGHTWYDFPAVDLHTRELYVGISFDTLLSPYFTWYHDYENEASGGADGNYYMFGVAHSFTLNEDYGISLDLGSEVGLNDEAFIMGDGGYYLATLGLTIPLNDAFTFAPSIGYSVPFGDLEDGDDGAQDDEFYGGFSLSASF